MYAFGKADYAWYQSVYASYRQRYALRGGCYASGRLRYALRRSVHRDAQLMNRPGLLLTYYLIGLLSEVRPHQRNHHEALRLFPNPQKAADAAQGPAAAGGNGGCVSESGLVFPSNVGIVDWQWALNESGGDPYLDHSVACFGAGEISVADHEPQ